MSKKKAKDKVAARAQMSSLFEEAIVSKDIEQGTTLIRKARRIQMKYKFYLKREWKRRFCQHCYSYLIPGKNSTVRTQPGRLVITCKECKRHTRIPISKRKVSNRTQKR